VSTEISPWTSKGAGRKTRLWLNYHDRHRDPRNGDKAEAPRRLGVNRRLPRRSRNLP